MKRIKRLGSLVAAAIIAITGVAVVAPAANAVIYSSGVFSVSYNGDLYDVNASNGQIRKLTFSEWQDLGSPTPRPAQTDIVKYAWSPTLYAVTFFGDQPHEWVWSTLTYSEWQRTGFHAPRNADWVMGTYFYKWLTNDEIFALAPDGAYKRLTLNEWIRAGSPTPDRRENEGFFKYSWDDTITRMTNIIGRQGRGIDYAEWRREAFPTPAVVARVPGDTVYKNYRDDRVWYAGPAFNRVLTYNEWRVMGFPAPEQRNPARPTNNMNCSDFRSWREAQDTFEYWYPLYGDVYRLDGNNDGIACNALRGY